jgi:uncharacterized DUF497 family protein
VRVSEFIVERGRLEHVARHGVTIDEVEEVVFTSRGFIIKVPEDRYRLIGQTSEGRFLTVILARRAAGVYALVTARPASERERRNYRRAMR